MDEEKIGDFLKIMRILYICNEQTKRMIEMKVIKMLKHLKLRCLCPFTKSIYIYKVYI